MSSSAEVRPPLPPFTRETATQKVRLAEDGFTGTVHPRYFAGAWTKLYAEKLAEFYAGQGRCARTWRGFEAAMNTESSFSRTSRFLGLIRRFSSNSRYMRYTLLWFQP